MRRLTGLAAASLSLLLLLAACSSDPDPSATGSSTGASTESPTAQPTLTPSTTVKISDEGMPTATGAFGEKPTITFPSTPAPADLQMQVLTEGTGDVVKKNDLLVVNYLGQIWNGTVFDNSYDRGTPAGFPIGAGQVIPGWDTALVGQTVGSRVLISVPPADGYNTTGNTNAGIKGTDTIVFVVDIVKTYDSTASGQADATPVEGLDASTLPTVTGDLGAAATIAVPAGLATPTAAKATIIATGTGAPLAASTDTATTQAVVQYDAIQWDNTAVESTWTTGTPALVSLTAGGVFAGLAGAPVGSRVILELPAQSSSPAYAVVVDIVAAG